MLETVGALALLALAIYFIFQLQNKNDDNKVKRDKLVWESRKCQALLEKYNNGIAKNEPIMNYHQLQKELDKIISDKNEIDEIEKRRKQSIQYKIESEIRFKENRKIGYIHEKDIFEIFDTKRELSQSQILSALRNRYAEKNTSELSLIFSIWVENKLISKRYSHPENWEVGGVLTLEDYKLIPTDLTRDEWLKLHNKHLEN